MAEDIGTLVARVVADTEQFRSEMQRLTGQIQTNTARMNSSLASLNESTKSLGFSMHNLRTIAGTFGVVLSARAFASWIKGALDAKNMTEQQIAAYRNAVDAISSFKSSTDDLARVVGSVLAPGFDAAANALDRFNAAFANIGSETTQRQIKLTQALIEQIRRNAVSMDGSFHDLTKSEIADIDELEKKLKELKQKAFSEAIGSPQGFVGPIQELSESDVPINALLKKLPGANLTLPPPPPKNSGAPPLLARPGSGGTLDEITGGFGDAQKGVNDAKMKAEGDFTKFYQEELQKRQRADMDAYDLQLEMDKKQKDARLQLNFEMTDGLIGLLSVLGEKHRGAAIAAIAIERVRTIVQIHLASLAAQAAAGAAAAWGGPAAVAAAVAAVRIQYGIMEAIAAATGLVEIAQISHGGSGTGSSTFGSAANPVSTTSGSSGAAGGAAGPRSAVQVTFQGPIYGFDDYVRKQIIGAIRDAVDGHDVVIIGPGSRQAQLLGGG